MVPGVGCWVDSSKSRVCVMDASGPLGAALVGRLLRRGYTVHAAVHSHDEWYKERKWVNDDKLRVFQSDPLDYWSIMDALKGCCALFYSFELPSDNPTYNEMMGELEVRAAHNVLEACAQTDTIDKVVFTSSASAVIWRDNLRHSNDDNISERNWSDINFCKKFKVSLTKKEVNIGIYVNANPMGTHIMGFVPYNGIRPLRTQTRDIEMVFVYHLIKQPNRDLLLYLLLWHGLWKTVSEKTAWELAKDRGVNMVSINGGLLVGSDLSIKDPYLQGAAEMFIDGVFVTVDMEFLVDAHICVFEDHSSYGRYLCFNGVINTTKDIVKLASLVLPSQTAEMVDDENGCSRVYRQRISNQKLAALLLRFDGGSRIDSTEGYAEWKNL